MCRDPHFGASTTRERARELRERLDDLGLAVAGLGTYTGDYVGVSEAEAEAELDELESFLELADVMGTDLIRHGVRGPPEREAEPDDYEAAAEWYREAADLAASYDSYPSNECHRPADDAWTDRTIAAHEREAMGHLLDRVA